jgi:hypothetical protein
MQVLFIWRRTMKRYRYVECLKDVVEEDIIVFKAGSIYSITGFDYNSLLYYIEPEFYEDSPLPEEFVIMALDRNFKFMEEKP